MLCVIRREFHAIFNRTTISFPESKCGNPKCHFCFPEEKSTDELANSWELCSESKDADFEMQEVQPEKVTVDELMNMTSWCFGRADIVNGRESLGKRLKQKLTYLVSLQEK